MSKLDFYLYCDIELNEINVTSFIYFVRMFCKEKNRAFILLRKGMENDKIERKFRFKVA